MTPAIEQLHRTLRHLGRIRSQAVGDAAGDDLRSFFENCWHLKDHIKNDPSMPSSLRGAIEQEVSRSEALEICADLANRNKHAVLNKHVRKGARIVGEHIRAYDGVDRDPWITYTIRLDDGSERDALDVAQAAVDDWKRILSAHGIAL